MSAARARPSCESRRGLALGALGLAFLTVAPRAAYASCKDASAPLGDTCRRYGDGWSADQFPIAGPRFFAWLSGRTLSYVPSSGGTFDGNVESSPLAYHFTGSALGSPALRSYGGETGAAWLPFPYVYLGAALAFGVGSASPPAFTANGLTITPGAGVNVSDTDVGGVVGVRLPLGALSLRADALLGASFLSVDQYASTGGRQLTASGSATAFLAEPRLHADVWLTPFVTLGLFAAMPSFTPSATNAGLSIAFHTSAFDGRFRLF